MTFGGTLAATAVLITGTITQSFGAGGGVGTNFSAINLGGALAASTTYYYSVVATGTNATTGVQFVTRTPDVAVKTGTAASGMLSINLSWPVVPGVGVVYTLYRTDVGTSPPASTVPIGTYTSPSQLYTAAAAVLPNGLTTFLDNNTVGLSAGTPQPPLTPTYWAFTNLKTFIPPPSVVPNIPLWSLGTIKIAGDNATVIDLSGAWPAPPIIPTFKVKVVLANGGFATTGPIDWNAGAGAVAGAIDGAIFFAGGAFNVTVTAGPAPTEYVITGPGTSMATTQMTVDPLGLFPYGTATMGPEIFAAVSNSLLNTNDLLAILDTTNGGAGNSSIASWNVIYSTAARNLQAFYAPGIVTNIPNYMGSAGEYDSTIIVQPAYVVGATTYDAMFVGGTDAGSGTDNVLSLFNDTGVITNANAAVDISQEPIASGEGPHSSVLAMTLNSIGSLVVGTNGGIWSLPVNYGAGVTFGSWSDLNGDLDATEANVVSSQPDNLNTVVAGQQYNGISLFNGTQTSAQGLTGANAPIDISTVTQIQYVPNDPNVAFAIVNARRHQ